MRARAGRREGGPRGGWGAGGGEREGGKEGGRSGEVGRGGAGGLMVEGREQYDAGRDWKFQFFQHVFESIVFTSAISTSLRPLCA